MASYPLIRFGDDRFVAFDRFVNAKSITRHENSRINFTLSNRRERILFYQYDTVRLLKRFSFPAVHSEVLNLIDHLQGGGRCQLWRDAGLVLYAPFVASTLSADRAAMTFTRATSAFYRKRIHSAEIILGEAAINRTRLAAKFGKYFLQMEQASENQMLHSTDYSQSVWTKNGVTVLANPFSEEIFSPNGLTPQRLTGTAPGDNVGQASVDNIDTNDIVAGFWVRAKNAPLNMRALLSQTGGAVIATGATFSVGQHWQNIFVRYNSVGSIATTHTLALEWLAAGVVYAWNAQSEYGFGFPTSPMISGATKGARATDEGFFTIPDNAALDMLKEGSLSFRFAIDSNILDSPSASSRHLVTLTDENDNVVIRMFIDSALTLRVEVFDVSGNFVLFHVQLLDTPPNNTPADQINHLVFSWRLANGESRMYYNGIERTPLIQSSGYIRPIKRIYIGSHPTGGASTASFCGYIGDFELRSDFLSVADMLERFHCNDILGHERNYFASMVLDGDEFESVEIPPSSLHAFELPLREVNPAGTAIYPEFPSG